MSVSTVPSAVPSLVPRGNSSDQCPIELLNSMTQRQQAYFQGEFNAVRKSETTGVLLALCLGGVGAHHFYLSQIGLGIVYVVFCWTFIPAIVALVECFFMPSRVRAWNSRKAYEIAGKAQLLHH